MVQLILFISGLILLIKGELKISDNKKIVRPQSTYAGIIFIILGIIAFFTASPMANLIYFGIVIATILVLVVTGKKIESQEAEKKSSETKRNLLILLIFLIVFFGGLYLADMFNFI